MSCNLTGTEKQWLQIVFELNKPLLLNPKWAGKWSRVGPDPVWVPHPSLLWISEFLKPEVRETEVYLNSESVAGVTEFKPVCWTIFFDKLLWLLPSCCSQTSSLTFHFFIHKVAVELIADQIHLQKLQILQTLKSRLDEVIIFVCNTTAFIISGQFFSSAQ